LEKNSTWKKNNSGSKKDNFWKWWTGPCGPCSEIHIDLRNDDERKRQWCTFSKQDNPLVIEIWNLVFIELTENQMELNIIPAKHVDTGMGFERLCMVIQNKKSNYDTDVFQPIINEIAKKLMLNMAWMKIQT